MFITFYSISSDNLCIFNLYHAMYIIKTIPQIKLHNDIHSSISYLLADETSLKYSFPSQLYSSSSACCFYLY